MEFFAEDQPFLFGKSHYPRGGVYGPINYSHLDLFVMEKGSCIVQSDNYEFTINANTACLIYSSHTITVIFPRGIESLMLWCETGEFIITQEVKEKLKSIPLTLNPSENLQTCLNMGINLKQDKGFNFERMRNSLGKTVFYEYFYQSHLIEEEMPLPKTVLIAKQHIDKHYQEKCDLALISNASNLNPRYLISLFKKHLGITPVQYLWKKRAEKGMKLLYESGLTVAEIAYQCGFQYPNHFSRHIKNFYGYTPTEIRSNRWRHSPTTLNKREVKEKVY